MAGEGGEDTICTKSTGCSPQVPCTPPGTAKAAKTVESFFPFEVDGCALPQRCGVVAQAVPTCVDLGLLTLPL